MPAVVCSDMWLSCKVIVPKQFSTLSVSVKQSNKIYTLYTAVCHKPIRSVIFYWIAMTQFILLTMFKPVYVQNSEFKLVFLLITCYFINCS